MKKNLFSICLVAAAALTMVACNSKTESTTETTDTMAVEQPKMEEPMSSQEQGVMVGGAMMVKSKNIVENAAGSAEHTTLVAAVKAADLAGTLSGAGPFTVFAPTNAAFDKLPKGTVETLLKPEMKADLAKILTYHVVPGALMAADLKDGQKLTTVQGQELSVWMKDGKWMVKDAKGNMANITIADVVSSNGVTYVIDGVLMPK
ncbi:MAG: fasciclin domain-containing protein [Ferruginibacter sp.]